MSGGSKSMGDFLPEFVKNIKGIEPRGERATLQGLHGPMPHFLFFNVLLAKKRAI
jgi:hypothetical protein